MHRSIFFLYLSILSDTRVECPISIHPSPNTNSKVNSTAPSFLHACVCLSNRLIQHNALRVNLNKSSSYYTLNLPISHSWLSECSKHQWRWNSRDEQDNTSSPSRDTFVGMSILTGSISLDTNKATCLIAVMIQHERREREKPHFTAGNIFR